MVKGRKGQHEVGLALKENIVKTTGEDGITTKCISACLLKARISIKSNCVTFVRGSLRSDRGTAGGAEGQIHSSPQLHGGVSARSEHLRFDRRERLDRKER